MAGKFPPILALLLLLLEVYLLLDVLTLPGIL
jgi:hypothetical protein